MTHGCVSLIDVLASESAFFFSSSIKRQTGCAFNSLEFEPWFLPRFPMHFFPQWLSLASVQSAFGL